MGLLGEVSARGRRHHGARPHPPQDTRRPQTYLPKSLRGLISETADISTHYEGFQANVCLNYGGRDEIVRAAMRFAEDYKAGKAIR